MTKDVFLRICRTGPESLHEAIWLYLYAENIEKVPLSWELARMAQVIGGFVLRMFGKDEG